MNATAPELPDGLRRATDADADGLIALVAAAYDEHPGCVLDLPGVDLDLTAPGTEAARRGSPWWVVERAGRLIATVGAGVRGDDGTIELKRLYVDADHRGRGLATELVDLVERYAVASGARGVSLWSDTRFSDAHRRYLALGYERTGEDRLLHDPSDTTEWRFVKPVMPDEPDRTTTWTGPFGTEVATLTALPDGWRLTSAIDGPRGRVDAEVEVDAAWRSRAANVTVDGTTRRLTSDGDGRWWLGGEVADHLAGAVDVDIEATPLTNTLPIRRLLLAGRADAEVTAAWIRVPGPDVEPLGQRYTHRGGDRWTYASLTGFEAPLVVDADGLVVTYGDRWSTIPA